MVINSTQKKDNGRLYNFVKTCRYPLHASDGSGRYKFPLDCWHLVEMIEG
jgi:hypothetical protein